MSWWHQSEVAGRVLRWEISPLPPENRDRTQLHSLILHSMHKDTGYALRAFHCLDQVIAEWLMNGSSQLWALTSSSRVFSPPLMRCCILSRRTSSIRRNILFLLALIFMPISSSCSFAKSCSRHSCLGTLRWALCGLEHGTTSLHPGSCSKAACRACTADVRRLQAYSDGLLTLNHAEVLWERLGVRRAERPA